MLHFDFLILCPVCSTADGLELGAAGGLGEALLGLVEVDDVPDGVEVLWYGRRWLVFCRGRYGKGSGRRV